MNKLKESMNKLKKWLSIWGILVVFVLIVVMGFPFLYWGANDNIISEIYAAIDVASAVAIAVLAFFAYFEYASNKRNTKRFLDQLEKVGSLDKKDAFVGIQFGGGNKTAYSDMKEYALSKNISENLICTKVFGDSDNNVSINDIPELEKYLKNEVIPMLSGADKIHLAVSGAGIAYYVCADILSNWKPIIIYSRNTEGKYEKWYTDNKHREKIESTLKNIKS